MGKLSKRYNKARQPSSQNISMIKKRNEEIKKNIGLSSEGYQSTQDESNALVLTCERNTKRKMKKNETQSKKKVLSKKERKKLQKIIDQKHKKEKRFDILKSLATFQVTEEELSMYKSTSKMGQVSSAKRAVQQPEEGAGNIHSTKRRKRSSKKKDSLVDDANKVVSLLEEHEDADSESSEDDIGDENDSEESNENQATGNNCTNESDIEKNTTQELTMQFNTKIVNIDSQKETNSIINIERENSLIEIKGKDEDIDTFNSPQVSNQHKINNKIDDKTEKIEVNTKQEKVRAIVNNKFKTPVYVQVHRTEEMQTARLLLPILLEEQVVMETIHENDVVVICGSTGSGKTTQVPQFLYEAGYGSHSSHPGMIGITEPRRVAAVSMSKRVAAEMNVPTSKVSFQIRYEGNVTDDTVMKFMTDGVLLKEMETDVLLSKYSVLIIDEAHERSVYTDILIGLLSRVVPLCKKQNKPLKLIIMSATLKVEDFTQNQRLFPIAPPVLKIDARQYPVTIHFNKRTIEDYVTEAYRKVCKVHRTLNVDGGILVFLTGQNEVQSLCRKLRKTFPNKKSIVIAKETRKKRKTYDEHVDEKTLLPKIDLNSYSSVVDMAGDKIYDKMDDDDDDIASDDEDALSDKEIMDDSVYTSAADTTLPLYVLPLYSLLSTEKQTKVFLNPPDGHRLCVVATNVAETSLTIPGIKYIIDCGKVKKKFYDKVTGVSTFRVTWTSKASANQRAGRAGRVGPGHCYRLYSSAVFQNDFQEFSEPEICRRPVDDLVLQMKSMCIDKVINFPFPSPPDQTSLQAAEKLLLDLGALRINQTKQGTKLAVISSLGKSLSKIPVSPRFSKMIVLASKEDCCLQYIIAIVAALTVKEIFTDDIDLSEIADLENADVKKKRSIITVARRKWAGDGSTSLLGDLMVILRAVGACEYSGCSERFCKDNGLRYKAMIEIRKLRTHLTNAVNILQNQSKVYIDPKMKPPSDEQAVKIRQIVLSGLGDHVARKMSTDEMRSKRIKNAYQCCSTDGPVYIHPTSSLFSKLPEYIIYHEIMETSKLYMKTLLSIEEGWLPLFVPQMCHFSKPLETPPPIFDESEVKCYIACTFGPHVWQLQAQLLTYPDTKEKYCLFARFLLEGEVIDKLKEFSSCLLTPASIMVKQWAYLQKKTENMLRCLMEREINNKEKLRKMWLKDPKYLLKQYLDWLPESKHNTVTMMWPPV